MYKNPIALSSQLKDKDTPSPRTFAHLINSSTPAQTLNYIVANKTQNSFCQHIYTTSLMNSNNFYLMNITAMVPRLGIKLSKEEYRILQLYLTSSHKTTFMNNMELKTASPSFALSSLFNSNKKKKATFKRIVNCQRFKKNL